MDGTFDQATLVRMDPIDSDFIDECLEGCRYPPRFFERCPERIRIRQTPDCQMWHVGKFNPVEGCEWATIQRSCNSMIWSLLCFTFSAFLAGDALETYAEWRETGYRFADVLGKIIGRECGFERKDERYVRRDARRQRIIPLSEALDDLDLLNL